MMNFIDGKEKNATQNLTSTNKPVKILTNN